MIHRQHITSIAKRTIGAWLSVGSSGVVGITRPADFAEPTGTGTLARRYTERGLSAQPNTEHAATRLVGCDVLTCILAMPTSQLAA